MGSTTANALPYPEDSDTPDIPRDIKALAMAVDTVLESRKPKTWVQHRTGNERDTVGPAIWGDAVGLQVPDAQAGIYLILAQFDYAADKGIYFEITVNGSVLSQGSDNGLIDRQLKTVAAVYQLQAPTTLSVLSRFGFGQESCHIYKAYTSLTVVWIG